MEKVGGGRFCINLGGGSALIINALPPPLSFCINAMINLSAYFDVSFPEKLLKIVATNGEIAWNSPNTVWRPGSARTRWGS